MAITNKVALVHEPAYVGMVADLQLCNRVSRTNKTATTITPGTALEDDGAGCAKPLTNGDKFIGILVRELVDVTLPGKELGLNPNTTGTVMTDGVIWVKAGGTVSIGDKVHYGTGATVKGMYTNAVGSEGTLAVAIPNAKFLDAGTKNALVRIKVTIGG